MSPVSLALRRGLSAGLVALSTSAVLANSNPPTAWHCYRNDQVTVLAHDKVAEVGTKFLVRRTTDSLKADCEFDERPTDAVIGEEADSAMYYIGLSGKFLMIDDGTGPDRELRIYNLPSTTPVFKGDFSIQGACSPTSGCKSDEFSIDATGVTFWLTLPDKPTARNCKDYAKFMKIGTDPEIEEKTYFRFATLKLEPLKERRCVPAQ